MIEKTLDRDYFMTAEQAREFGLIDKVITGRDEADGRRARSRSRPMLRLRIDWGVLFGLCRRVIARLVPNCEA